MGGDGCFCASEPEVSRARVWHTAVALPRYRPPTRWMPRAKGPTRAPGRTRHCRCKRQGVCFRPILGQFCYPGLRTCFQASPLIDIPSLHPLERRWCVFHLPSVGLSRPSPMAPKKKRSRGKNAGQPGEARPPDLFPLVRFRRVASPRTIGWRDRGQALLGRRATLARGYVRNPHLRSCTNQSTPTAIADIS